MRRTYDDLRVGFRALLRQPGYLAVALLTLGLGIGASTAMFSVVDAALLRPLPFHDPGRLGMVWGVAGPDRDIRGGSLIEISDWRQLTHSFTDLVYYDESSLNLSGDGEATQLEAEYVSPGFFGLLGVRPALGRALEPEDDRSGALGAAVISDALWKTRYGGSPSVLDRPIQLDGQQFRIVGVMPAGFKGLSFDTDIWVPWGPFLSPAARENRGTRWLGALARLAPGVPEETAQADLDRAARRLAELYPDTNRDRGAQLIPLKKSFLGSTRSLLLVLLGGVGLLLLIACANVANLQLVRTTARRHELSVRHALGASRGRIARQLVTESVGLALLGGLVGLFVADFALGLLLPLVPPGALPDYVQPRLDPVVLGFAVLVAVTAGVVLGLVPALRSGADPAATLKSWRSAAPGWRRGGISLQQLIVGVEVAMAAVVLAGAGLAVESFRAQLAIDPGFRAKGLLAARVSLTSDRFDAPARRQFVRSLSEDLGGVAAVQSVAIGSNAPLRGSSAAFIMKREGHPDDHIRFYRHSVTPAYFHTLGIPLERGRGFTESDNASAPSVVVVSEALAARLFPGANALGKRLRVFGDWATIVGIAGNVHFRDLTTSLMDPGNDPDVYFSWDQLPAGTFDVVVRDGADPATLAGTVRRVVARLDPAIPTYNMEPMARTLAAQTATSRLTSALLALFGILSLLLAAIGLYGVMAFIVRGRRREIAIRGAVGATPTDIRRLVLRQGLRVVAIGLLVGGGGALAAGRLMAGLLYGIRASDPAVLVATSLALLGAAALANWIPALQATRVDPQKALSEE